MHKLPVSDLFLLHRKFPKCEETAMCREEQTEMNQGEDRAKRATEFCSMGVRSGRKRAGQRVKVNRFRAYIHLLRV